MLTSVVTIVLFSVVVIQWVTSPDSPQGSNSSSKNDSHELGSQHGEPDNMVAPARRPRNGRRANLADLEDFDTPDAPDRSQSRASSRRELSTEAMIDSRATISISHDRKPSGSTDTLPSPKAFDLHVAAPDPAAAQERQNDTHGLPDIATPEEVRVRGSNLYVSRIWRQGP